MIKQRQVHKWIDTPQNLCQKQPFTKANYISSKGGMTKVQLQQGTMLQINQSKCHQYSSKNDYEDMCEMLVLNQPQILNNISQRFNRKEIFTRIGSTLLVVNPYQTLPYMFSSKMIQKYRRIAINDQFTSTAPHIYGLAGKSYSELVRTNKKQTIIISGQSGAGKTETTKFCLQLLTSLSHSQEHSIEQKILSCNPILQAFGNSKTVRNDNSSRFGKYVQIYFDQAKNITGATIKSYLLEKSRVVELQKDQRNYHCFYALLSGKSGNYLQAKSYTYLKKSNCFHANNINDAENFTTISKAMKVVGFSDAQIQRIWQILRCILEIGNIQIDDSQHQKDEARTCIIKNKEILTMISKILGRKVEQIDKFLLYQKRKFLKEYLLTPYNQLQCRANMDSLSKQLYSKTFDFILTKINEKLRPHFCSKSDQLSPTINILDIFGFENFQKNSFEQICINFTNQKLLNIYNKYVFQKELQILREDGLQKIILNISPPNNQNVLQLMHSKKVSIFSLINDLTPQQQFKDKDILMSIRKQLNNQKISYPNKIPNCFIIQHSQCPVNYSIQGFKSKNKDKIKQQIVSLVQSIFFQAQKSSAKSSAKSPYSIQPVSSQKQSKTLLSKFTVEIQLLMSQLQSSSVHFVRCLKPNNQKLPQFVDSKCLLNQVRYLGVFQTIRIRKTVFPCRKSHEDFSHQYNDLLSKDITVQRLLTKFDKNANQFILGKKRVYLSPELEERIAQMKDKVKQIKERCGKVILKQYRVYKFRKTVLKNLKTLKKKRTLLSKYSKKDYKENLQIVLAKLWGHCLEYRQKQLNQKKLKARNQIQSKQKAKKQLQGKRNDQIRETLANLARVLERYVTRPRGKELFIKLKQINLKVAQNVKKQGTPAQQKCEIKRQKQTTQKQGLKEGPKQKWQSLKTPFRPQPQPQPSKQPQRKQNYPNYESVTSVVEQNQQPYYQRQKQASLSPSNKIKKNKSQQENKMFSFPKQFVAYDSLRSQQQETVLFRYNLKVDLYDANKRRGNLSKLRQTVKIKTKDQQDKGLVDSVNVHFKSSDLDRETYNKIVSFSEEEFSQKYLRKRSKLVGKAKKFNQIFSAKRKPLQKSLTKMQKQHQNDALKIFRQILKINHDGSQQFTLKVIQNFLSMIVQAKKPQQIVNEAFLQLLKQINTDIQNQAIKAHQLIFAFLHFFRPHSDFLEAGLYILFQRLQCHLYTQKQQSYLRLALYKTYRKSMSNIDTKYIPSKYQLYCLICKKLFPFNLYLSLGNCVQEDIESDQTFADIKQRVLEKFGVDTQRISPKYFGFFQIITFEQGDMQQIPISDEDLVWDVKSFWEIAIAKYQQTKITPPKFYFLLKLKFPFQLHKSDFEGTQLIYSQCFFEYFTGKIRVPDTYLMQLASLVIKIKRTKLDEITNNFIYGVFPLWAIKKHSDQVLVVELKQHLRRIGYVQERSSSSDDQMQEYVCKFDFVRILQNFPLAMSIGIPPDSSYLLTNSSLLYYLKPRRLYVVQKQNMEILEEFELKKMVGWEIDGEKLSFQFRQEGTLKTKTHIFYTEYAQLFSDYLREIGQLMKNGK